MGDESFVDSDIPEPGIEINKPSRMRRNARAVRRGQNIFSQIGNRSIPVSTPAPDINQPGRSASSDSNSPRMAVSTSKSVHLKIDVPLLFVICTLVIFGLLMVHSASWKFSLDAYNSPTEVFTRQLLWTGLGVVVAVVLSLINYHRWQKLAVWFMLATVIALIVVLFVRDERNGAVRTLLGGSIQPSEMAKIVIIIYLSAWLFNRGDQLREVSFGLLPLGVILGVLGALIMFQPDLSAVITIFLLGGMMFFLAGGDLRQIVIVIILGALVGWLLVQSGISSTGKERVDSFTTGLRDPLQASNHVQRSMESFVKGGLLGVGIGKADTKLTVLPFPHTDSIFAVIGEETGILGASMMVLLYGLLMWRGIVIARRAPDKLGTLLAAGLSFWLAMEAFINMAVMVGLLPFAGNALPLISAGGSNRLVSLAAIGILLNISRLSFKEKEEKERVYSAVVSLRRRDWRRGIPRPRRPSVPTS